MNKPQLFLLHFAGGSRYSFEFMKGRLQQFEFVPLELPGRGRRLEETLITDFEQAAEDMYGQLIGHLRSDDFLIYGHSMGASLALKVTAMLEKSGRYPAHLIVTGNAGPGVHTSKGRHLLEQDAFKVSLKELGGIPDEVLEEEDLFAFYEPILRADFQVVEECNPGGFTPVRTPLFALMGDREEDAGRIANWKNFVLSSFHSAILPGDHFFILKEDVALCNVISSCYSAAGKQYAAG